MAEEGTLGLARAHDTSGDELSKEELQRRMDEARDSISQTVTEIKDTVVHQYESVKDTISETLDWREQFKKQPVAWSAGAVGAGFLAGYGLAAVIKGPSNGYDRCEEHYGYASSTYAAPLIPQNITGAPASSGHRSRVESNEEESGPGLLERIQETHAFDRLRSEASAVGNRLVDEVSKTAQEVLLPAAVGMIRGWLEGLISKKNSSGSRVDNSATKGSTEAINRSSYQPVLERTG
jgi:hypothetical protein